MNFPPHAEANVPLAPMTTIGVGGNARWLVRCPTDDVLAGALEWARRTGVDTWILGQGSNVVIADDGLDGLVISPAATRIQIDSIDTDTARVVADAGVPWDTLVERMVAEGLAGLECLSGIPGYVGASPIQNVGAYGQDVSAVIESVGLVERSTGEPSRLEAGACGFGYRTSVFKTREAGRYVVTDVAFRLARRTDGVVRYRELADALGGAHRADGSGPPIAEIRRAVLEIRARKSMVLDPEDPNARSCGSFFVNPVLTADAADAVRSRLDTAGTMPAYPEPDGRVKLSAAWLIESSGFRRGHADGAAGLSSRHALAIVNRGGARAADVVRLARTIRRTVHARTGVTLMPEPAFWGFGQVGHRVLD